MLPSLEPSWNMLLLFEMELSDLVEKNQYRAGKIISGAIHWTSKVLVYTYNLDGQASKIVDTSKGWELCISGAFLFAQLSSSDPSSNLQNLQNSDDIRVIRDYTVMYENSFLHPQNIGLEQSASKYQGRYCTEYFFSLVSSSGQVHKEWAIVII